MKLAVIAANGRSGQAFVKAALAAGHEVKAGIHGGNPYASGPHLTVVACDATNAKEVETLIQDCDAVISFIGHVRHSPPLVQTKSMEVIISAMRKAGSKRLVSLTGTGVRFEGDTIPFIDRVLNVAINLIDPNRVRDGIEHVKALQSSELDWTVLRVLKLQDGAPTRYALKEHGPTKLYVSRQDVAAAALTVVEEASFIRKAPILSHPRAT